ncbi:hypothetical protein HOY80DRAFT_1085559 [Tuber brumale]|nr:hypothetical protein HOY80DRAFT_1085559 [Tuber brumale]
MGDTILPHSKQQLRTPGPYSGYPDFKYPSNLEGHMMEVKESLGPAAQNDVQKLDNNAIATLVAAYGAALLLIINERIPHGDRQRTRSVEEGEPTNLKTIPTEHAELRKEFLENPKEIDVLGKDIEGCHNDLKKKIEEHNKDIADIRSWMADHRRDIILQQRDGVDLSDLSLMWKRGRKQRRRKEYKIQLYNKLRFELSSRSSTAKRAKEEKWEGIERDWSG